MPLRDDSPIENFMTFSERLLAEGYYVFRDDFGNTRIRKMSRPSTLIEIGAARFAPLLQALAKDPAELTPEDRETICNHDPRFGFHPHNDVEGARKALCEHYKF